MNPSTFAPMGLFWTIELPEDSVEVEFGKGQASLRGFDVPVFDYGSIPNALFGPPPSPLPTGTVSLRVVWSGPGHKVNIRNTDPTYGGFAGGFVRNKAQMGWAAQGRGHHFASHSPSTPPN